MSAPPPTTQQSPLREILQPFVDLFHAPRALWGINLAYFIEGWVYFGMLGYLAMHFSDFIFEGVPNNDIHSHHMVMVLTAGITISMFFLGSIADRKGIRRTLLTAFVFLLAGRIVMSAAPSVFPETGLWSPLHLMTMGGILLVVVGYGMYMPAAYAGVRKFTSPKTAAMGYAMLYALMNLGGWFPSFMSDVRHSVGITGAYWFYTSLTVLALLATLFILTRKVELAAIARIEKENEQERLDAGRAVDTAEQTAAKALEAFDPDRRVPPHLWATLLAIAASIYFLPATARTAVWAVMAATVAVLTLYRRWGLPAYRWLANHPLADAKFFFFIFALIPVQTLFTYNWLVLPQYFARAFTGVVSERFELFSNLNPILIFIAVPIVTALTQKKKIYNMMMLGTFVMAAPAFLLALGTNMWLVLSFLFITTMGEAMWQPRFLQYAAEIAPEGRTGAYMGVAQFPWFLTKMLVPLYSGAMIQKYCPAEGPQEPQTMWFYYALIAMVSTVLLVAAKGWAGKDFKAKAA
ncbi:MAG: MFS transporter [bacterium]|nr:MFS transporter [bacterium]